MKSEKVKQGLRKLRKIVDTSSDPIQRRIAQAMETAIAWATSNPVGWPEMDVEAKEMAKILRDELHL